MLSIAGAYINALLADATYALETGAADGLTGDQLKSTLSGRMTDSVAEYISNNLTVVTHFETSDTSGSGFFAPFARRTEERSLSLRLWRGRLC